MTTRRFFLTGLASTIITAPAIVRASSLMPIKVYRDLSCLNGNVVWLHEQLLENISSVCGVPKRYLLGKPEDELAWSMAYLQHNQMEMMQSLYRSVTPIQTIDHEQLDRWARIA